jgi:hypothetical protein
MSWRDKPTEDAVKIFMPAGAKAAGLRAVRRARGARRNRANLLAQKSRPSSLA